ncbi:hypothetical protein [Hymenobacter metallicola]|uniref:Uncharacterized protein n=1 Tax=Hymenobacter metallicola TaxID=2563114 RepID=A0A4Z0Q0Q3_9BACT|nr:hypothetical protein [Hymenobacter metallicola]TGE22743.1 hypothetical protein E5K02_23735 [Hymenobacter metallicola]
MDYFLAQLSKRWQCDLDQESIYNFITPNSLPYEKYVVLTLGSHAWMDMESQLGICFLEKEEATYTLLGAIYKKCPLPASQFSAIWESTDPTSKPCEFVRYAEYIRCQYSPNPILWQGEINLTLSFPPAFFESVLAQDVLQQIKPL